MIATDTAEPAHRALVPEESAFAEVGGVRIAYEVFGEGEQTILLLPPWAIIHSRFWKLQVPYLARHFRVVTFDPRGNGRSDRPESAEEYGPHATAQDALAVLDAAGVADAVIVCHCAPAAAALLLAADHPERVRGAFFMSPALPITPALPERTGHSFDAELPEYEGWAKANRHFWARDYRDYLEFFFERCYTEPHSTKQFEDSVAWALETTPETLALTMESPGLDRAAIDDLMARVSCPLLVTQGDQDELIPPDRGAAFAQATGAELVELVDVGHCPHVRHPVRFNELLHDFAARAYGRPRPPRPGAAPYGDRGARSTSPRPSASATRGATSRSPVSCARCTPSSRSTGSRRIRSRASWRPAGEHIHPASRWLANESRHIAAESREHELNVFQAWRRMDEILLANFMVFRDVVRDEPYDLWIGDEAWELDYYLHENPELKTAPYAFLTDFVGWLPMPEGGDEEARLTADYNAEMIEQIARFPRVRDKAIFVGGPDDVIPRGFGDGLPAIRPWVHEHFDYSGYVLAPDAGVPADREALRAELGYRPDEVVCLVTVGGSGVGAGLLRSVIDAYPQARQRVPGLRMIVVCGPRIDPEALPSHDGLELVTYVDRLSRHLAACDVAVTQGGLTTCMELAAAGRPFVYFPLRRHFEQNLHVRHRLERYGAGHAMDLATATPETIADAIAAALADGAAPAEVERDGAARAARLIGGLL